MSRTQSQTQTWTNFRRFKPYDFDMYKDDKVKLDIYKTYVKAFLDNSHVFFPFKLGIPNQNIQELPIHYM